MSAIGVHQEIIGQSPPLEIQATWDVLRVGRSSWDTTRPNYAFWDKFSRGEMAGFKFSSQFAKPIIDIRKSWTLGKAGVKLRLAEQSENPRIVHTNELLDRWTRSIQGQFATILSDLDRLGDQYVIVNSDGSLSVPSPDTVKPEYDPLDYRRLEKVTVTTLLDKLQVTDVYTAANRVLTLKNTSKDTLVTRYGTFMPAQELSLTFENLTGELPVVHFTNDRGSNETNGRPRYASLYHVFSRYNDLAEKGSDGAELLGNPIPTWVNVPDPAALKEEIGVKKILADGTEETVIEFDPTAGVISSGGFELISPPVGFTSDIRAMLKFYFLLILENQQIPETVWGGEMGQARATSQEQMKTFYQMIEGRRQELEGQAGDPLLGIVPSRGLHALTHIWLQTRALVDPQVIVDAVTVEWEELSQVDEALRFEKTKYADQAGLVRKETALDLLGLVEDPAGEIQQAEKEHAAARDAFDASVDADLKLPDAPADTADNTPEETDNAA